MKYWVVDSGATKHIYANKSVFFSYIPVGEGEETIYLDDSRTRLVLGKEKILIKLISCKTLVLINVLHVPNIRANLVSISLSSKVRVKVSFESNKFLITKNNMFVGKNYCNQGFFVLNVFEIINENVTSSTYMLDSVNLWHGRLGHVNNSYIKKMQI